ncbi:MAG: type II toxin-antitoxin system PemK/MazF family toxin [Bacillota bacterium]|nr:type II toxin-antitoxin system PemK/MazF family toxin [Bacillota bacterium]
MANTKSTLSGERKPGKRPALTISPRTYNERSGLALFCPLTTQVKGYPFEVKIPPELGVTGVILSNQVRSLDWEARGAEHSSTRSRLEFPLPLSLSYRHTSLVAWCIRWLYYRRLQYNWWVAIGW